MASFPCWLERERVQHIQLAVVASHGEKLRRWGPGDTRHTKSGGGGVRFKAAQDSPIRAQHDHTASRHYSCDCVTGGSDEMLQKIILNSIFAVYLHSSTQSHTAIMLPSGDQEQPLQSRVGSCVRFARTQPEALEKTER
jgi:hypothetical protein